MVTPPLTNTVATTSTTQRDDTLGCLGSLALSAVLTVLLLLVLHARWAAIRAAARTRRPGSARRRGPHSRAPKVSTALSTRTRWRISAGSDVSAWRGESKSQCG